MVGFNNSEMSKRASRMLPTTPDQVATTTPQSTVTDILEDSNDSIDEIL